MTTIDMSAAFAAARLRGEVLALTEALTSATERAERAEAHLARRERDFFRLVNSESNKALKARAAKLVEEIDALKERNRQAVGDWRKVRAELTASATHAESLEAEIATLRTRAEQAEAAAAVEVAETREWRTALMRCAAVADKGAPDHVAQNPGALVAFVAETIVGLRTAAAEAVRDAAEARRERGDAIEARRKAEAEVARLRGEYERGLREAADVARAHGGISAYYAITKLAAEVEPAAEVSDG